jgi:ATP-binding cassette subfamily F protein 3
VSHDRSLLRALATKVWVLHERHITEFDGPFTEWEQASAERAHAASVRAAEEEALRRVKEKEKLERARREAQRDADRTAERRAAAAPANDGNAARRDSERESRRQHRELQRRVEEAERRVAEGEARVAALTSQLDDPELYTTADGTKRAAQLGKELDAARARLDAALEEWAAVTEQVETGAR